MGFLVMGFRPFLLWLTATRWCSPARKCFRLNTNLLLKSSVYLCYASVYLYFDKSYLYDSETIADMQCPVIDNDFFYAICINCQTSGCYYYSYVHYIPNFVWSYEAFCLCYRQIADSSNWVNCF